jgi:hypothetical protein
MKAAMILLFLLGGLAVLTPRAAIAEEPIRFDSSVGLRTPVTNLGMRPLLLEMPDGSLNLTWVENAVEVLNSRSTNGGATWSSPVRVNDSMNGQRNEIRTSLDSSGVIYAAWQDYRRLGSADLEIYFSRSLNGGASWSTNLPIYRKLSGNQALYDGFAVSSGGVVYVIYSEGAGELWMHRSANRGVNWDSPRRIVSYSTGIMNGHSLIIGPQGKLHLLYSYASDGSNYRRYYTSSTDGGANWASAVLAENYTGSTGQSAGECDLKLDEDGVLYAAWYDARSGSQDVWTSSSSNGGGTWSSAVRANDRTTDKQIMPVLCLCGSKLLVSWYDQGNGNAYVAVSENGGSTWRSSQLLNDVSGTKHFFQDLLFREDVVHVVWMVNASNKYELRYRTGEFNVPPVVDAGSNISIFSSDQSTTTLTGTATDPEGDDLTARWVYGGQPLGSWSALPSGGLDLDLGDLDDLDVGAHVFTFEVSDGTDTASASVVVTVKNSPPVPSPTGGGVYEIGSGSYVSLGGLVADWEGDELAWEWRKGTTVLFSGTITTTSGGTPVSLPAKSLLTTALGLGVHTLDLAVDDGTNEEVVASIEVEVIDSTAPTMSLSPSPSILWPPKHDLVTVILTTNAADSSGGSVTLSVQVTSDEPPEYDGDGNFLPDHEVVGINQSTGVITLKLRAERSGKGDGRSYTITVTATDQSGNASTAEAVVAAPHDKSKK